MEDCVGSISVVRDGNTVVLYEPQTHPENNQLAFHQSDVLNLLFLGTRGGGKSTCLRWDAIGRCLTYPGFKALLLRRTIQDLRKSHLNFIGQEMHMLGGKYRQTTTDAIFSNGSTIQFSHCETIGDILNYLSAEYDWIGLDELSTFQLDMFLQISASARTPVAKPYKALIRACSNPLGPGAQWMREWFVDKTVHMEDFPDYDPNDFHMLFSRLEGNKYVSREEYEKKLKNQPEHIRRAWLLGEFIFEGAYFSDFRKTKESGTPWHCIKTMPTWKGQSIENLSWISVYRAIDWGYFPDPAVCLWIAVLPNTHAIVFKERTWRRTLAPDVAREIKLASAGMNIVDSFIDPSTYIKTGVSPYSIADLFEQNGVPVTPSQNDRELFGYAIHQQLNTLVDEHPQLQIVEYACPELVRTLPILQMDKTDPRKIADGPDHWAVALAYHCMGKAMPSRDPVVSAIPRWLQPKKRYHPYA